MNVLSDILCTSSPLILSSSCNGPLLSHDSPSAKVLGSKQTHLIETLSSVPNVTTGTSSNQIDSIFHVTGAGHGAANNLMNTSYSINSQNEATDFPVHSYGNVQPWFPSDLIKASENMSPGILPQVSEIYGTEHHSENLHMLEIGFQPDIPSQSNANCNIGNNCIPNSQNLMSVADAHGFPCSNPLLMSSFTDVNNSHISIEKTSQSCGKYDNSGIVSRVSTSTQSLINDMIPLGEHCELSTSNQLLSLTNHIDDSTLNTPVNPVTLQGDQGQAHPMDMMAEKLPHITLNQLDSILDDMQIMTNSFPSVSMADKHGCNNSYDDSRIDSCSNNLGVMACNDSALPNLNIAAFTPPQQTMIEISRTLPQDAMHLPVVNNTPQDLVDSAIEEVYCFKCKYCNYICLEKSGARNHVQEVHLKNQVQSVVTPNCSSSFYSNTVLSNSHSLPTGGGNSFAKLQKKKDAGKGPAKGVKKTQVSNKSSEIISPPQTASTKEICDKLISNNEAQFRNGNCDSNSHEAMKKAAISKKNSADEPKISPQRKISSHMKAWQKKIKRELGTYICEFKGCNVRFRALDNLEYHRKCHIATSGKFACPECGTNFDNWGSTAGHLWRQHSTDMELHACSQCSFRTYSLSNLENLHNPIHQDKCLFLCDTCGKGFKNGKQLRNHREVHDKKRNNKAVTKFPCPICSRPFAKKKFLRHHMSSVHHNVKSYSCSYCHYSTSNSSTLRMHLRQHTGEKPFACDICSYQTVDHNSLRRHKMTHSGEKPYKCPYCEYACIQSSTYKVHLKKQHPEQSDQHLVFTCSICPYRTVKRDNYLAHVGDHELKCNKQPMTSASQRHTESEVLPLVEAVDISLSHGDPNLFLGSGSKDKDIQSYLWNENCAANGDNT